MPSTSYPLHIPALPDFWYMDLTDPSQWAKGPNGRLWAAKHGALVSAIEYQGAVIDIFIHDGFSSVFMTPNKAACGRIEAIDGLGRVCYSSYGWQTQHAGVTPASDRSPYKQMATQR